MYIVLKFVSYPGMVKVVFLVYQNLEQWMNPETPQDADPQEAMTSVDLDMNLETVTQRGTEEGYIVEVTSSAQHIASFVNTKVFSASINSRADPQPLHQPIRFLLRHVQVLHVIFVLLFLFVISRA